MDQALAGLSPAGANRLSMTRLDEAPYLGRVAAASARSGLWVGYLSEGPRIPDDLLRPTLDGLLDAVLEPTSEVRP